MILGGIFYTYPTLGLEWPSPHDYNNSVWDELKFIPIIGSDASIEVGSIVFLFPSPTSRLPIKKIYLIAKHFKPQLPTSAPPKTLNLTATQGQKRCYRRQCYRSDVEVLLQKTMLQRWCWSNGAEDDAIEAVLKRWNRKRYWSGVAENVHPKDN